MNKVIFIFLLSVILLIGPIFNEKSIHPISRTNHQLLGDQVELLEEILDRLESIDDRVNNIENIIR